MDGNVVVKMREGERWRTPVAPVAAYYPLCVHAVSQPEVLL